MVTVSNALVEEACATSNSYQVQTGHRHRKKEKRMLIGISIRSVTSKRSCALDDSPSCEKANDENEREEHLKLHRYLVKSLNNVF